MFEVSDFLSAEEAALVRDLASPTLARSGVKTTDGQNEKTAMNVRTSTNTFLERGQTGEITALEERVHRLTRTWYDEGEHIQVVRYLSEGQQMYEAHWDYFNPDQYRTQPMVIERMDLERRWVARTGVSRARAWPHCERVCVCAAGTASRPCSGTSTPSPRAAVARRSFPVRWTAKGSRSRRGATTTRRARRGSSPL